MPGRLIALCIFGGIIFGGIIFGGIIAIVLVLLGLLNVDDPLRRGLRGLP